MLALIAEGHSNEAIADRIAVSERTVESHVAAIFRSLDLPPAQASTGASKPPSLTSTPTAADRSKRSFLRPNRLGQLHAKRREDACPGPVPNVRICRDG